MANRVRLGRAGLVSGAALAAGLSLGVISGAAHAAPQASSPAPVPLANATGRGLAIDPATNIAYVPSLVGITETVYAVDLDTNTVIATIPIATGYPSTVAVDPTSNTIYVGDQGGTIWVIDGATDTVTGTISPTGHLAAASLTFDAANGLLYAGLRDSIDVINPATNSVTTTITGLIGSVTGLTANAQGTELYAASGVDEQGYVYVIDTTKEAVVKSFDALGDPVAVALDGTGTALYVTDDASSVARYDLNSGLQTGRVNGIDWNAQSAVDTVTGTVYTTAFAPNDAEDAYINQLNSSATTVTGQIPVPSGGWIAVDEATNTLVYATNTIHGTFLLQIPLAATSSITSGASATFTTGNAGTFTINAAGTPAPTFTETGKLPAGVTLSNAGTLRGTPKAGTGGVYPITITASNGLGSAVTQRFTLTVDQPAAITSASHATFTTGKAGKFTITATGYPAPKLTESGKLPAGTTWTANGTLSGTPKAATGGVYKVTIAASNGIGSAATQAFTLTDDQPVAITSANHATFTHGRHGSVTIRTSGYPAATVKESGTLPSGLKFTAGKNGTATISGTPATSAKGKTYVIRLTATNKVGATVTQRFTIKVG